MIQKRHRHADAGHVARKVSPSIVAFQTAGGDHVIVVDDRNSDWGHIDNDELFDIRMGRDDASSLSIRESIDGDV